MSLASNEVPIDTASRARLDAALVDLAATVYAAKDLEATLHALVDGAVDALPEIDHAGVSIAHRDGRLETLAGTDLLVWELDAIQYDLGDGPCVYALREETVVTVEHAADDPRWPSFLERATERGLRSQLGVSLYADKASMAGLNLYSTTADTISPETVEMGRLFATHAALALGKAQRDQHLGTALTSRQMIGTATGVVMERYGMNRAKAFEYLVRISNLSNVKLRDIAQEFVDVADQRQP